MRYFNKQEQGILRKIIKKERVYELLYEEFPDAKFIIENNTIELYSKNQDIWFIQERIAVIMNLLEYLKKEGLIYLLHEHNDTSGDTFIGGYTPQQTDIPYPIGDESLKQLISLYSFSRIFVAEDLKDLVNHHFQHAEDRKHRQILFVTIISIIINIIISVFEFFYCGC